MVINLAHLGEQRGEGSAAALVQASRHNVARCSRGNVMTVRLQTEKCIWRNISSVRGASKKGSGVCRDPRFRAVAIKCDVIFAGPFNSSSK